MTHRIVSWSTALFCTVFALHSASADVVTLTSGRTVQGTVIQKDPDNVLVLADYGTTSVPANLVESITAEPDKRPTTLSTNTVSAAGRIPEWRTIIIKLAAEGWANKLRQIPATVITNGVLKNVPYISFRCGTDYEMNIYGDLDNPAGIELGFYRSLLLRDKREYAAGNAVDFVASVLPKAPDKEAARKLDHAKDMRVLDGLTLEITPETAEDSYGGWWVSVYDTKALDQARVSDKELAEISILNSAIIKEPEPEKAGVVWTKDDLKYARPATSAPAVAQPAITADQSTYSPPVGTSTFHPDVAPEHNHGSVYVHSYYRKDGTFVSSYTRRR